MSSRVLDAHVDGAGARIRVARTPEGVAQLCAFCREHRVELVAMEATGGLERLVHALVWQEGIACAIVNPRQVRHFAQALGLMEKTDPLDAAVIARFAAVVEPRPQPPRVDAQERLGALVVHRRQLVAARVALANQRRLVHEPLVLASIARQIASLEGEVAILEDAIRELVAADPLWARLEAAFREIKGVAGATVATLLAEMPEIGSLDQKAAAKLVGLAPLARDSGQAKGRRHIRGGRASLRSLLVLVAGLAARHDPDFRAVHARLTQAGKPKLVVRVALARKLLVRLNAKARDVRRACQPA